MSLTPPPSALALSLSGSLSSVVLSPTPLLVDPAEWWSLIVLLLLLAVVAVVHWKSGSSVRLRDFLVSRSSLRCLRRSSAVLLPGCCCCCCSCSSFSSPVVSSPGASVVEPVPLMSCSSCSSESCWWMLGSDELRNLNPTGDRLKSLMCCLEASLKKRRLRTKRDLRSVSSWLVAGKRCGSDPDAVEEEEEEEEEGNVDSAEAEDASEEEDGDLCDSDDAAAAALVGRGAELESGEALRAGGTGEE